MADKKDHIKGYGTREMQGIRGDTVIDHNPSDEEIDEGDLVSFEIENDPRLGSILNDTFSDDAKLLIDKYSFLYKAALNNKEKFYSYQSMIIDNLKDENVIRNKFIDRFLEIKHNTNNNISIMVACDQIYLMVEKAISINDKRLLFYFSLLSNKIAKHTCSFDVKSIKINEIAGFIDKQIANDLKHFEKIFKINNKNTALDEKEPTTNTLGYLKEQKDDPKPRRIGRDFQDAQWTEKPKTKSLKKERQPVLSIRSFRQVFDAIDLAREESGELKNEWIIRAIIDRLATDHPAAYEWLKEQKDDFPEVRSDARTGIDFILDKN